MAKSYRFEMLLKHSNETALNTRKTLKHEIMKAREIFGVLDHLFHSIEKKPKCLVRNVKLALTARFTNHIFSALLLIERGLVIDAFNCTRSALETTAFYWLVCHDESAAALYDGEKSPPPVKIRKRLEGLGVDVQSIRDSYNLESTIVHVGNRYDNIQIQWEKGNNGKLLIGGGSIPVLQKAMLHSIVKAVFRFMKFEKDYIVSDIDDVEVNLT